MQSADHRDHRQQPSLYAQRMAAATSTCPYGRDPLASPAAPTPTKRSPPPKPPRMQLKSRVRCSDCGEWIRQLRWKCLDCPTTDLCVVCKVKTSRHASHSFLAVPLPPDGVPRALGPRRSGTIVECDSCNKEIVDIRWKCASCPNFDLCHRCYVEGNTPHHRHHSFVGTYLVAYMQKSCSHDGLACVCSKCGKQAHDIHYHCTQCDNLNLCKSCIPDASKWHDLWQDGAKHDWAMHLDAACYSYSYPRGPQAASPSPDYASLAQLHHTYHCSNCNGLTAHSHYRCEICPGYRLCNACFLHAGEFHPNHIFGMVSSHSGQNVFAPNLLGTVTGNMASSVGATIVSATEAAVAAVANALSSAAAPLMPGEFPRKAVATTTVTTTSAAARKNPHNAQNGEKGMPSVKSNGTTTVKYKVICDECRTEITGTHYKCAFCPDYDLCAQCEARANDGHLKDNPMHPLIKFLRPLAKPMDKPLLSPSIYEPLDVSNEFAVPVRVALPPAMTARGHGWREGRGGGEGGEARGHGHGVPPPSHFLTTPPAPALDAKFVEDVTVPDATPFEPGERFTKIWNVTNVGSYVWPVGTKLVHVGGDNMSPPGPAGDHVPVVTIGKKFEKIGLAADLVAPMRAGRHRGKWRLATPEGLLFGDLLWCDIVVCETGEKKAALEHRHSAATEDGFKGKEKKKTSSGQSSAARENEGQQLIIDDTEMTMPDKIVALIPQPAEATSSPLRATITTTTAPSEKPGASLAPEKSPSVTAAATITSACVPKEAAAVHQEQRNIAMLDSRIDELEKQVRQLTEMLGRAIIPDRRQQQGTGGGLEASVDSSAASAQQHPQQPHQAPTAIATSVESSHGGFEEPAVGGHGCGGAVNAIRSDAASRGSSGSSTPWSFSSQAIKGAMTMDTSISQHEPLLGGADAVERARTSSRLVGADFDECDAARSNLREFEDEAKEFKRWADLRQSKIIRRLGGWGSSYMGADSENRPSYAEDHSVVGPVVTGTHDSAGVSEVERGKEAVASSDKGKDIDDDDDDDVRQSNDEDFEVISSY
ncbi:hypothetical protein EV182_001242 [Spiromyces aspiralis]|uniref:Uncharacterized protein n=1 Tax=Spiromyces aspiralis TaxID=68401 RepID=A0ACC1HHE3_9FUNG|nr:hypothetical protein EV182_001242 [Spiromyces aspiralis]